mgnify:CR=1
MPASASILNEYVTGVFRVSVVIRAHFLYVSQTDVGHRRKRTVFHIQTEKIVNMVQRINIMYLY